VALEQGERARFEHDDGNLLVVNLREQQTADALTSEVDALFDYFRAQADIRGSWPPASASASASSVTSVSWETSASVKSSET
jgi:hypothetical protein